LGRTTRGVRGVICTLSSDVETPGVETLGERRGCLGISRGEVCGGGKGERLFRLRSREGMKGVFGKQRKTFPMDTQHSHNYPIRNILS
jgi:hypothetical protein